MPWASVTRVPGCQPRRAGRGQRHRHRDRVARPDHAVRRDLATAGTRSSSTALSERVPRWSTSAGRHGGPWRPVPPGATPGAPTEPDSEQRLRAGLRTASRRGVRPGRDGPGPRAPGQRSGWTSIRPGGGPRAGRSRTVSRLPPSWTRPAGSPSSGAPPWPPGAFGLMPPRRRWRTRRIATWFWPSSSWARVWGLPSPFRARVGRRHRSPPPLRRPRPTRLWPSS